MHVGMGGFDVDDGLREEMEGLLVGEEAIVEEDGDEDQEDEGSDDGGDQEDAAE